MSPLRKGKFQSKSTRSEFLSAVNSLLMWIKNFSNKEEFGRKGLFGVYSKMKSLRILLLFLVFSLTLYCQHDFLEPRHNYINAKTPVNKPIEDALVSIERQNTNYLFQFIELKTGNIERSFTVEDEDSIFFMSVYVREENAVRIGGFHFSKETGSKLLNLLKLAMNQTQFQEGWEPQKNGPLFLFNLRDEYGKVHYAEKWNPDANSNIGELTGICHSIFDFDTIFKPDLSPLEAKIDTLTKKMEISLANYLQTKSPVKTIRYFTEEFYELNSTNDTITYYELDYKLDYAADTLMGFRVKKSEKYVRENNSSWRNFNTGKTGIRFVYISNYHKKVYNLFT